MIKVEDAAEFQIGVSLNNANLNAIMDNAFVYSNVTEKMLGKSFTYGYLSGGGHKQDDVPKANNGDIIGVLLDMENGSLSFEINGFRIKKTIYHPDLTKGPLYPVVALDSFRKITLMRPSPTKCR